jgi:hypothetical protein
VVPVSGSKALGTFLVLFGFLIFLLGLTDTDRNAAAVILIVAGCVEIAGILITSQARRAELELAS